MTVRAAGEDGRPERIAAVGRRNTGSLIAIVVDTVGAGAFYPLTLLYLIAATHMSVQRVGVTVTVGSLLAFPAAPIVGAAIDRYSTRQVLVAGNVLSATGYALLLLASHSLWLLLAALAVVGVAERCFWSSWNLFVAERVPRRSLDRWFARLNAVRSASLGIGALGASVAVAAGGVGAMRVILALNIVSSVAAGWLFSRSGRPGAGTAGDRGPREALPRQAAPEKASWRPVLRDRPFLVMTCAQTALCFAWLTPVVVLPLYLVSTGKLPLWLPSAAVTVNTALTLLAQTAVTRRLEHLRRARVVSYGAALLAVAIALFALGALLGGPVTAIMIVLGAVVVFTFGELAIGPASAALSVTAARPDLLGRYGSLFQMSWTVSSVLGPAVIALLLGAGVWWMWGVLLAMVVAGGAAYALLDGRLRE